jgi:hypothetical protein
LYDYQARAPCPQSCGRSLSWPEARDHVRNCDPLIACDLGCGSTVKAAVLSQHKTSCTHRPATCANSGCGMRMKQLELESHGWNCDHRLVVCDCGCGSTVKAGVLSQHTSDAKEVVFFFFTCF